MTKMCEKVADPFKIVIWKVGNLHYSSLPRDLANVVFTLAAPQVQNQHHSNYQNCQLCDKSIDHQVRRHYLLCLLQNYLITLTNTLEVQIPTNLKSWNTNTWIFTSPNQDMYLNTRPTQLKIWTKFLNCSCLVSAGRGWGSTSTSFLKCFSRFLLILDHNM